MNPDRAPDEWEAERIRGLIDPPRLASFSVLLVLAVLVALGITYYEG